MLIHIHIYICNRNHGYNFIIIIIKSKKKKQINLEGLAINIKKRVNMTTPAGTTITEKEKTKG